MQNERPNQFPVLIVERKALREPRLDTLVALGQFSVAAMDAPMQQLRPCVNPPRLGDARLVLDRVKRLERGLPLGSGPAE